MKLKKLSVALLCTCLSCTNVFTIFASEGGVIESSFDGNADIVKYNETKMSDISEEKYDVENETDDIKLYGANNKEKFVQKTVDVRTAKELKEALENHYNVNLQNDIIINETLKIDLTKLNDLSDEAKEPEDKYEININGNGYTIKGEDFDKSVPYDTYSARDAYMLMDIRMYGGTLPVSKLNFNNVNIESDFYKLDISTGFSEASVYLNEGTNIKNTGIHANNLVINGAIIDGKGVFGKYITMNAGVIKNVKKEKPGYRWTINHTDYGITCYGGELNLNGGKITGNDIAIRVSVMDNYVNLNISDIDISENKEDFCIEPLSSHDSEYFEINVKNDKYSYLNNLPIVEYERVIKDKEGKILVDKESYDDSYENLFAYLDSYHLIKDGVIKTFVDRSVVKEEKVSEKSDMRKLYAFAKISSLKLDGKEINYDDVIYEKDGNIFAGRINLPEPNKDHKIYYEIIDLEGTVLLGEARYDDTFGYEVNKYRYPFVKIEKKENEKDSSKINIENNKTSASTSNNSYSGSNSLKSVVASNLNVRVNANTKDISVDKTINTRGEYITDGTWGKNR